jgi:rhodanese-related sulfurtransferase
MEANERRRLEERGPSLAGGVATIVIAGIVLGMGQNALTRQGGSQRGLAWIATERTLDDLEAQLTASDPSSDSRPGGATPLPPDMNDPMAIAGTVAPGDGIPEIPDLGRPLDVNLARVKQFWNAGAAVFVDARTLEEYVEGHIPGAVHMDYEQAVTDPAKLEAFDSRGRPIVIYCGGGTCEVSKNLGYALTAAGHSKVLVYTGGWPEWLASGLPVSKGESS